MPCACLLYTSQPAQEGDHQQQLDLVFDDEDTAQKQRAHGVEERGDQERLFGVLAEEMCIRDSVLVLCQVRNYKIMG